MLLLWGSPVHGQCSRTWLYICHGCHSGKIPFKNQPIFLRFRYWKCWRSGGRNVKVRWGHQTEATLLTSVTLKVIWTGTFAFPSHLVSYTKEWSSAKGPHQRVATLLLDLRLQTCESHHFQWPKPAPKATETKTISILRNASGNLVYFQ